ncbi:DUF3990 domain-containing protein [uncultured Adlercreutzia sp.]|uniref:DUF3990 domain-containing protein n=1 Tax=uncultured Adlercreutzia sp. TaxID=875803 RepID=UPI0025D64751|nr:DUF3990 domain-containing protein [uncultured Adlercreutzia sp.]MCI9261599.1 DUF3990 domain-containing protein [Eggerthellaceae bacterium]
MRLYHASTQIVDHPRIVNRTPYLDFGTGFYTTTNLEQAEDFARKAFVRRGMQGQPTLNEYEFNLEEAQDQLNVLEFSAPDQAWLDFVVHNRKQGRDAALELDLIVGPVANDDVFTTVTLYEGGQITATAALEMLKIKKLFMQILFCSEHALEFLQFVSARTVER